MLPDIEGQEEMNAGKHRQYKDNNILTGVFLLLIGAGVLLKNMDTGLPGWIFSWEMLALAGGIYIGVRHNFRGPLWIILILLGGFSLQDQIVPTLEIKQYTWPAILIALGLYFIFRPKSSRVRHRKFRDEWEDRVKVNYDKPEDFAVTDKLDVTTILGNIKKVVVSKNFKGGEIVSFMGGSDINLSQADINGRVRLAATNIMGGTKLIVPSNWDIQSELVAIFGGVEDKRDMRSATVDPNKILVLEGTCIFGGIEIKSY
jgi:predicted membrane protein